MNKEKKIKCKKNPVYEKFSLFKIKFENGPPTQLEFVLLFDLEMKQCCLPIEYRLLLDYCNRLLLLYHLLFEGGLELNTRSTHDC